jgi:ATP-dependent Clp protease ATP-binding subunit ClpA
LAIEMGGQLKRLENRLAERRVSLVVTDAACRLLAQRGWDRMAMMLLEGKFSDGDTITVDVRAQRSPSERRPPHRRMLPAKETF